MAKDPISRADELAALGWPAEDVARYAELWEYRRRWGAMNLEREDRLFLRKAEAALPPLPSSRSSARKTTRDKSYVRWLCFYLEAMRAAEAGMDLAEGEQGAWPVILEEELRLIDYEQPVLGLPDTLKARELAPRREAWAAAAAGQGRCLSFDFAAPLETLRQKQKTSWRPLREGDAAGDTTYPVLSGAALAGFRHTVRTELAPLLRTLLPSLADTDRPPVPEDWMT